MPSPTKEERPRRFTIWQGKKGGALYVVDPVALFPNTKPHDYERIEVVEASPPEEKCGHRSPLNYDHSRWATCTGPEGHEDPHSDGTFIWDDKTMPYRPDGAPNSAAPPEPGLLELLDFVTDALNEALRFDWDWSGKVSRNEVNAVRQNAEEAVAKGLERCQGELPGTGADRIKDRPVSAPPEERQEKFLRDHERRMERVVEASPPERMELSRDEAEVLLKLRAYIGDQG